ncbi:MAG: hypothetical protein COA99_10495 [Moraxellaceae bacterium]|nr:MAG: hypothetical protein COA99_10495 [Moraxellaceae bacterium]
MAFSSLRDGLYLTMLFTERQLLHLSNCILSDRGSELHNKPNNNSLYQLEYEFTKNLTGCKV